MKRILLVVAVLFASINGAKAANGDTTWVQAHADKWLDWYNNFDTAVVFPDGSKQYRKIYMVFTLGKYSCPNNPQYCGDWDYDIENYLMTPGGDTVELGRLITPYAGTGYAKFTMAWKHRYIFDVTNYYPLLKNNATMRLKYSGYSGGFTANIKFAFIEGTPPRNVLAVKRVWHGGFDYGHGSIPINTALAPISLTAPAGTQATGLDFIITGHGGDDQACAEFCPNTYTMSLDGSAFITQNFFRENCAGNQLFPQSGTWVYNRANWCPGDLVQTYHYNLNGLTGGNTRNLSIQFPSNYTSTASSGNTKALYKIDGAAIYYAGFNKATDVSIDDIIAPTNAEMHFRENPVVGSPVIEVSNTGSNTITSIKFEYNVVGRPVQTYTWTGSLGSLSKTQIKMPVMDDLKLNPGSYQFVMKAVQVNGAADEDASNNELKSTFTAASAWPNDFYIRLYNTGGGDTKWRIEDLSGNIVKQNNNCGTNATCIDTVHLQPGAYRMVVSDTDFNAGYYNIPTGTAVASPTGDGLYFFSGAHGYIRAINGSTLLPMPNGWSLTASIPSAPATAPEGNFGFGFTHYFYTGFPNAIKNVSGSETGMLEVYPNPAKDNITVALDGINDANGTLKVVDAVGKVWMTASVSHAIQTMSVADIAAGTYYVLYENAKSTITLQKRIVILK